jgi:ubiquinol-cytochrome c reductase cytochrome c1 subunit
MVAATTRADPTVGLIFYDLKHCLSSMEPAGGDTSATEPPPAEPARAEPVGAKHGNKADDVAPDARKRTRASAASVPVEEPAAEEPAAEEPPTETDAAPPAPAEYTTFVAPRVEPATAVDDDEPTAESVAPESAPVSEPPANGKHGESAVRVPRKRADGSA